jgi:hypothetical protein
MASNFKISASRNRDSLHLKLLGDFDGSSALELINTIKKNSRGVDKIFIHTSSLKNIFPFGQHILKKNLCVLNNRSVRLLFTGMNARQIAPNKTTISSN